jgi:hypothetical protein
VRTQLGVTSRIEQKLIQHRGKGGLKVQAH